MENNGANKIILAILGIAVFLFMFGGMSGLALLITLVSYVVFFFIGVGLVSALVSRVQPEDEEPTTLDELTPEQKEILRKHHEEEK